MLNQINCIRKTGILLLILIASLLTGLSATEIISGKFIASPAHAQALQTPEAPRVLLDTRYVAMTGVTINVSQAGNLQSALDLAKPGDEVVLQAGATFTGNFYLRGKEGSGWITVRTSNLGGLAPEGVRVSPASAPAMARLVSSNSSPVLTALSGTSTALPAHHYRFVGIEFTATTNLTTLIKFGDYGSAQSSMTQVPNNLTLDRCYAHGSPNLTLRRAVALNSASTAIVDSHISDCHEVGADSQAIAGWNGPGPFKIVNNYLEGAGENVMFGGADPSIAGLIPSDIEFRRNHCYKPLSWKKDDLSYAGTPWTVKNLFELKNAQRVLVEGNIFENCWLEAQTGYAILLKSVNQDGTAPWCVTQDVEFRYNIVRHAGGGVNVQGRSLDQPAGQTARIQIANNLFEDISQTRWNGDGGFLKVSDMNYLTVNHNTVLQSGNTIVTYGTGSYGFVFTNNIVPTNLYGVKGDGTAVGNGTLNTYFPGCIFNRNALAGGTASSYPAGNFFPSSLSAVGFMGTSQGDYHLSPSSVYNDAATDGSDLGANIDAMMQAINDTPVQQQPPPPPAVVPEEVVLYASEASVVNGNWTFTSDVSAAAGVRLTSRDSKVDKVNNPQAFPKDYFELSFNAVAGVPYRLWLRGKAQSNSPYNDSVHVQFSGSVTASGSAVNRIGTASGATVNLEDYLNSGLKNWGWQDNGWGPGVMGDLIYFEQSGPQMLRVQLREDGVSIDQILLSPKVYLNKSPGSLKNDSVIVKK